MGTAVCAAAEYCLLLYDHRGHGASPAPEGPYSVEELGADVIALLDELGVDSVSFCGLSLGGMVGLWLAAHHPQRIERLVVMCALARLEPVSRYTRAGSRGPCRRHRADRRRHRVALVHAGASSNEHPDAVERFSRRARRHAGRGIRELLRRDRGLRSARPNHRIDAPTLLIAGADDPIVRPASAVMFGASFRDASVAVVPDAAHLVNVEQPEIVNRLVLEHCLNNEEDGHERTTFESRA